MHLIPIVLLLFLAVPDGGVLAALVSGCGDLSASAQAASASLSEHLSAHFWLALCPNFECAAESLKSFAEHASAAVAMLGMGNVATSGLSQDATPEQLRKANERLSREVAAHETTLGELESVRCELESRVAERTKELSLIRARFETALRGARVYVFSQDRDLRYTWVYGPDGWESAADMLGRTDDDMLPASERDAVVRLKRGVLDTGKPANIEVSYLLPEGRTLVALRVDPMMGADGRIDGITCAAIDVSQVRSLESEQRRLAKELATALQRYDTALRGSSVTVFTQDQHLRYTSISNPLIGRSVDAIVGRTDDEILPAECRDDIVALKRAALDSGQAKKSEVHIVIDEVDWWFDMHVEPLRDPRGDIVGITCATVDVTERKEGEAHLRMLMRELTHRSKNLLAVIQAMARQTARHAGSTDAFLAQFGARLQALATSHDLLVQEGWHGASLNALVDMQLGHHLDKHSRQVRFEGPSVLLKPEAAQSVGLALHELATNAAKYGALSDPRGIVTIAWRQLAPEAGGGIELVWEESGGPPVAPPKRRGFGSTVIERHLANSIDTEVTLEFAREGVRCRIIIPLAQFVASR